MVSLSNHAQACFTAHQVAEKALKALAYYRGDRVVLGHSLMDLADALRADYPQVSAYSARLGILDRYYVSTRYPDALPGGVPFEAYEEAEATAALDGAAELVDLATRIIG